MIEVYRNNENSMSTPESAKIWTENSLNSKLDVILKILNESPLLDINYIKDLNNQLKNKNYREFQFGIGMSHNRCDGKLGPESLSYFNNYIKKTESEQKIISDTRQEIDSMKADLVEYKGQKLTRRIGTVQGPSGKETYYNMPMNNVINTFMKPFGYTMNDYWIRDDGVKMLGQYVMVAANLNDRPRGSILPTSLGLGIVCDTGEFAKKNPKQLDIAVSWGKEVKGYTKKKNNVD